MIRTVGSERDGQEGGRRGKATSEIASRAFDVVVAGLVLLVVWPVLAAVASAIRLPMGSPVLFRQQPAGRLGAMFEVVKFRTMRTAEPGDDGPDVDEARPIKFGRRLRATSLDDLPALVNVLRGEMGLVGPRPPSIRYLPRYSATHARRHEVRPGITGWAQAHGRNALTWDDQLDMDAWYVDNARWASRCASSRRPSAAWSGATAPATRATPLAPSSALLASTGPTPHRE